MNSLHALARLAGVLAIAGSGTAAVHAASPDSAPYPTKPIRMLAPEPGPGVEVVTRMVAQGLAARLGQPVVMDNRGAGGGIMAFNIVLNAPPDGYTLIGYGSTLWLGPYLRSNVKYDPLRDFTPVSMMVTTPFFVYVHASVPVKSVKELIAHARAKPGELHYGSAGTGAATHLAAELFKSMAGVNITRVAYKGSALASNALMSGEVQVMFGSALLGMSQVKTGRLRALGIAAPKPSEIAPGVPAIADAGLPGYEAGAPAGIFGPAKMPRPLVERLSREIAQVIRQPDVKEKLAAMASEAMGTTPDEAVAMLKNDMARWGRLIKDLGIREE